ncbi:uncharacterized protein (UPF0276 family) [Clostridium punense]|uniref:Uncharacterized protein (UPF0276 family) n=1 Tax=Clostridium punense TaxID=1054297 RepID=A0ABS4K9C2_9CLOT|nr:MULTISPECIES: DUF692 family multinuclear iron-containing protein [Clostridium]EQB89233.1 hypothetical protein M918_03130 [Clostridium sp. BL8]MBP2024386.1 uncharacterized protein (UPF0276 family) [Clostridium punense]
MLLGCNYSEELINLISRNRVKIDYIKLGLYDMYKEGMEISSSICPILLHGVAGSINEHAGMKLTEINEINWEEINRAITLFKSPHLGFHLSTTLDDWDDNIVDNDIAVNRMIETTKVWAEHICVPFLVENIPYYGFKGTLRFATDPSVINMVCEKANVGLILDIAHARVSASNRNEDVYTYILNLPLDKVKEIHVVGVLENEEGLRDKHLEMQEEDYKLLEWVLTLANPSIITLEYGGPSPHFEGRSDIDALERQLTRLMKICENH